MRRVVVAIGVDRIHDQRLCTLIIERIAGIDPLDLARNEAVSDVARVGAAELLRQRHAEQPASPIRRKSLGSVFSSR